MGRVDFKLVVSGDLQFCVVYRSVQFFCRLFFGFLTSFGMTALPEEEVGEGRF